MLSVSRPTRAASSSVGRSPDGATSPWQPSSTAQSRGFLCSGRRPRRPNGLRDTGRYKAAATLRCSGCRFVCSVAPCGRRTCVFRHPQGVTLHLRPSRMTRPTTPTAQSRVARRVPAAERRRNKAQGEAERTLGWWTTEFPAPSGGDARTLRRTARGVGCVSDAPSAEARVCLANERKVRWGRTLQDSVASLTSIRRRKRQIWEES